MVWYMDMIWLCYFYVEASEDMEADERWQQYWRDNGQQLVWNDWLQKYPEHSGNCIDGSHSDELTDREACQRSVNADSVGNENEVLSNSGHAADSKSTMLFVNGQTGSVDDADFECTLFVDCEDLVKTTEPALDSSSGGVNITNIEIDSTDSLAAEVMKHSSANGTSGDQGAAADRADEHSSWNRLWEQHYAETYWYYHDWFMQWLNEERQILQPESHTEQSDHHVTNDVQQLANETYHLHNDLSQSLRNAYVATSQESLTVVESLLSELLLSVIAPVNHSCPADGNGRKQKNKNPKHQEHGLFGISYLLEL